jgi:short-subunit dehydrogenase
MNNRFKEKAVVIIGASGGLGESYARAFSGEGARLLLAGRNKEKLLKLADRLTGEVKVSEVDIADAESVKMLADFAQSWAEEIDIIINAAGYDVRKSLENHEIEEIKKSLDTNLLGAILVTKAFLPIMKEKEESTIVHMGGFADGHLAFPYYSIDVATRAGIFSFIESMNRELYQEGSRVSLTYFCPNAADTKAERPYHNVWKEIGVSISSTEQVASELLKAVDSRKSVYLMGGLPTRFFAKLNALFPKLTDALLLRKYGKILRKHFGASIKYEAGLSEK